MVPTAYNFLLLANGVRRRLNLTNFQAVLYFILYSFEDAKIDYK